MTNLSTARVWEELGKASFAIVSYVTPAGEPRSSGVVYKAVDRRLYIAVAPDSWKARHIAASGRVSVTVPVRRGGVLSLLFPIPPATVSFSAAARVHPAGSATSLARSRELGALLPPGRQDAVCIVEVSPEGEFVTYGLGVSLMDMRVPAIARARVPAV
jgi:pyridoxamine 5'-phosphate oxidase-like protein